MPAIRYRLNACAVLLTESSGSSVDVLDKNGEWKPVSWLGFVCQKGAKMMTTVRPGKIRAGHVSNGSGVEAIEWRTLTKDEYVLGVLCPISKSDKFGIFGVVDKNGWPIVKSNSKSPLRLVG